MGASKTAPYSDQQNSLAIVAKSIAHPARVAIIDFLLYTDSSICEDIVRALPLTQASVAEHLRKLRLSGVIIGSLKENAIIYKVNKVRLYELKSYLRSVLNIKRLLIHKSVGNRSFLDPRC